MYCPEGCFHIKKETERKDVKFRFVPDMDYCKGCCICVAECPRGAISVEVKK